MKIKIIQNIFILDVNRLVDIDEEIDINDNVAKELIKANYAVEVKAQKRQTREKNKTEVGE